MTLLNLRAAAILVSFSLFPSCSLRLNEPLEEPPAFSVKVPGQDCIGKSGTFWKQYFDGKATTSEVEDYQICLGKALRAFLDSTTGANPNLYTPQELAGFTQKYFFENKKLPEPLLKESMKLKVAIFGGSSSFITRTELETFLKILPSLGEVAVKILPLLPIDSDHFFQSSDPDRKITETIQSLASVTGQLNRIFANSYSGYSTTNLQNLFRELENMFEKFGWETPWAGAMNNWLSIAPTLKKIVTNSEGDAIAGTDWPKIVGSVPAIYEVYLRTLLITKEPGFTLKNLERFKAVSGSAVKLFQDRLTDSADVEFSPRELSGILNAFLPKNENLNTSLTRNLLILKTTLAGGKNEALSYSELTNLAKNFHTLGESASIAYPAFPLTGDYLKDIENDSQLTRKMQPILQAGKLLSEEIRLGNAPYEFNDAKNLLSDLEQTALNRGWDISAIQKIKRDLPLFASAKAILFQSSTKSIHSSDLKEAGTLLPGYLKNYYRILLAKKTDPAGFMKTPLLLTAATEINQLVSEAQKSGELFSGLSKEDVRLILSSAVFDRKPLRNEWIQELFRLKAGLAGGSSDSLTPGESLRLTRIAIDWLESYKRIQPFLPIDAARLIRESGSDLELKQKISEIQEALSLATRHFSGVTYSLNHLKNLLEETETALRMTNRDANLQPLKDLLPSLEKSSRILLSRNELSGEDWKSINHLGTELFALYLRWKRHLQSEEGLLKKENILISAKLTDDTTTFLTETVKARGNIPFSEADVSLALEFAGDSIPYSKSAILNSLRVLTKYFVPGEKRDNRISIGIRNLAEFRAIYTYYFDGLLATQGIFQKTFGRKNYESGFLSRKKASNLILNTGAEFALFRNSSTEVSLHDLSDSILNIDVFFHPSLKKVLVPKFGEGEISYYHLSQVHLLKTVNKLLLRAFGNQKKGFINESQTNTMFAELKPLFQLFEIDVKQLVPAIPSRFFEASLFLPHSDGKPEMNMNEAIEMESLFLSVIAQSGEIRPQIAAKCGRQRADIPYECFLRTFAANTAKYWQTIPNFQRVVGTLPLEEKISILKDIDLFLRRDRAGALFTENDIRSLLQVGYYIELLLYRFDSNKDGLIDQKEAKKGFPLFRGFIAKKAAELGRTDPDEHFKIFTYILAKQKVPATFFEKIDYLNWKADAPFAIDREGVIRIFSTLLSF